MDSANSRNPANSGSLAGVFQEILGKFLAGTDDMLPAKVIAYDRATNRAQIQPLIQMLATDGSLITRAQIASVPVFQLGGGGAVMSFNIVPGDLGWLKANDRDISLFLQRMAESAPNTNRKHNFSDAMFFPDQFRQWTLNEEDEANAVWQTLDGTKRIAIGDDNIKVTSDTTVDFDAPLVTMSGNLTVAGTITGRSDVVAGVSPLAVKVRSHTHSGVTTGSGNSGIPNVS